MGTERWGLKCCEEHKLGLLNRQLWEIHLLDDDVLPDFFHYLDTGSLGHLEVKQTEDRWMNYCGV